MADIQNNDEQCSANVPEAVDEFIPQALVFNGKCRTSVEYILLIQNAYKLLTIKQVRFNNQAVEQCLSFKFLSNGNGQLVTNIRTSTSDLANLPKTVVGLYSLLTTITSGLTYKTTDLTISCITSFNNQNVNDLLETLYQQDGDDKSDPGYKFTLFVERFIPACLKAVKFVHQKARMGVELYYDIVHLKKDIAKLKIYYHQMLTSLKDRAKVNNLLLHVMVTMDDAMKKLKNYSNHWEENSFKQCTSILEGKVEVHRENFYFDNTEAEDDGNLKAWVEKKLIYNHLLCIPDISPESVPIFKGLTEDLHPIINGIRTFTPSPLEIAKERAAFMKITISKVVSDAQDFLSKDGEHTIGKAKYLLDQIKSKREAIDNLQLSGLVIDHQSVGVTLEELDEYYVKISNILSQQEFESKINEAKQRAANNELAKGAPQLELPPLTGFSSWLNFKKSLNEIMPLHSNPLVKKQILLKSLRNKEDKNRCQNMDYENCFSYLIQRYESSALIPELIDSLLEMSPAISDKQSYENLTQLISTTAMIKTYDQLDKLDNNARSKLMFILLHRELQLHFLKDQSIFEESIRKEICSDLVDLESLSDASCLNTPELESKRRSWWLEQMTRYLGIARDLVKHHQSVKKNSSSRKQQSNYNSQSKSYSVNEQDDSQYQCPICDVQHIRKGDVLLSLSQCFRFRRMDVQERISIVDTYDHCKICLRAKSDGQHNDGCTLARERQLRCTKCDPPSASHHTMIHCEDYQSSDGNDDARDDDNDYSEDDRSHSEDDRSHSEEDTE